MSDPYGSQHVLGCSPSRFPRSLPSPLTLHRHDSYTSVDSTCQVPTSPVEEEMPITRVFSCPRPPTPNPWRPSHTGGGGGRGGGGGDDVGEDEEHMSAHRHPSCPRGARPPLGPWTPEEDRELLAFVEKNGARHWRRVSKFTTLRRDPQSCRLRWTSHLSRQASKLPFTSDEDKLLMQLVSWSGETKWATIAAQHFPTRTGFQIQQRWHFLMQHGRRQTPPSSGQASPKTGVSPRGAGGHMRSMSRGEEFDQDWGSPGLVQLIQSLQASGLVQRRAQSPSPTTAPQSAPQSPCIHFESSPIPCMPQGGSTRGTDSPEADEENLMLGRSTTAPSQPTSDFHVLEETGPTSMRSLPQSSTRRLPQSSSQSRIDMSLQSSVTTQEHDLVIAYGKHKDNDEVDLELSLALPGSSFF